MRPDLWNILEPVEVDPRVKSWKDVLRNLVFHANDTGEAWPNIETIRREVGYKSRKAVIDALAVSRRQPVAVVQVVRVDPLHVVARRRMREQVRTVVKDVLEQRPGRPLVPEDLVDAPGGRRTAQARWLQVLPHGTVKADEVAFLALLERRAAL